MQDGYTQVRDSAGEVAITSDDFLFFAERAVGGMSTILGELGDELANTRPAVPGANTPYALLTHCLGVMEYWGGHLVAGRAVRRDRQAEFHATGPVAPLRARAARALETLRDDVRSSKPWAPLHAEPDPGVLGPRRELTRDSALQHLYEELAQHHGQMEIMRDCLLAARRPADPVDAPIEWLRAKQGVKWHRPGPSLLPAWVADMDFPLAPVIAEAIGAALDRGDLGYPDWDGHPLAEAFAERMRRRHGWQPDPGLVRGITDLIQGLQLTLTLLTEPGDGVVAFTPNYPPFLRTLETMGRPLVAAPLEPGPGGRWTWDHDLLEQRVRAQKARILLLVNPHNPTGKVFTADELRRVADLAERHGLIVISDEIHADLVHTPHRHQPFAALDAGTAARTVTVTSASKAFNIAGLRTAIAHVGPAVLRTAWDAQPPDLYGATNVLGVEATRAAWAHGDEWLAAVTAHLTRQRDHLAGRIAAMPGLDLRTPEAGYLAWLDCQAAGLGEEAADWFRRNAGVELSAGSEFGSGTAGSVAASRTRLNFATTREVLDLVLDRMADALADAR
ncbi:aminotransferase class I/II-fold pyridoxal phosphate-dependent enzyme [Herbidospora yilanensis]|uniref:aminotransferase class I/II-fold pyridoxal phosphate-dependent enzyme n=1 Tax=Herbidospora yilanensis TaxID=354426 RepID=UPI000A02EC8B|nr:aminotransferase class I/II-fold pyridoxal phosphate-dependent enzyme [Herbidospora yilanensis]